MIRIRKVIFVVLIAALCLSLGGCRPSKTFTEILYDQNMRQSMEEQALHEVENEEDNEEPDDSIASVARDENAETQRDRERTDPSPGSGQADDKTPSARKGDTLMQSLPGSTPKAGPGNTEGRTAPSAAAGTQGNGNSEESGGEGSSVSEGIGPSGTEGSGTGNSAGGAGSGGTEPGTGEIGENPKQQIVDDRGDVTDIPDTSGLIAAPGEAALIVRMLQGTDRLAVSSASVAEGLGGRILSAEGWQGEILWEGDGSLPMSDSAFSRLLEMKPGLCIGISGRASFTDGQIEALRAAGIQILTIPAMRSAAEICEAVRLVGEVLDNRGGAEEYVRYWNDIESSVRGRTSAFRPDGIDYETGAAGTDTGEGVYALYVSGWDPAASYSLQNESIVLSGSGMAVTESGYLSSPVTSMLSLSGIANSAALAENNYSLANVKIRYLNPIINNLYSLAVSGGSRGASYRREYVMTSAGGTNLGDDAFPAVIVSSRETAAGLADSPLWSVYPYTSSASGNVNGYGFLDSGGNLVESTVHGPYSICVIPDGAGRWDRGSAESILLPEWAAWQVRGLFSEQEVRNRIADFYQRFYGYSLTDSELNSILAGRESAD